MNLTADVLIVTVTDVESAAILQVFQEFTGEKPKLVPIGERVYHDLGKVNGAHVLMAISEMGAGGLGAAQQTVQKGILATDPSAVILVGIAFGVNREKQAIGDILVSTQLWLYDLQRIGKDKIITRGDKPHASAKLINYFRSASLYWNGAKVRFGLILAGEKLVDNIDYREQLKSFEPEAIGGEMESAGLYVACQDVHKDWILVKGICDWADGQKDHNKDAYQLLAAQNAANFVLHALKQVPFKREYFSQLEKNFTKTAPLVPSKVVYSSIPNQSYFFGREKELSVISEAISPEARTWGVLVDGPGGIGKTALVIQAGHLASPEQFPLKIFLSAKVRELTPSGEQPLEDFMLPNYMALLSELARELGKESLANINPNERANAIRRALADKSALIIIDNVETFEESERIRLYQFLSRLPASCKAIVTSRRRSDIDARIIRLDRLALQDALDLLTLLARNNRHLQKASDKECIELYELTNGNPLLIKWVAGQLGRSGSRCRTIQEACEFIKKAPRENDPLEYVFGDLVDTFTESETKVLAALAYFTQPVRVEWVSQLANLSRTAVQTALEDLSDRALLVSNEEEQIFFLPPLAATFLKRKKPEITIQTGNRLVDYVTALSFESGYSNYERFSVLETEWEVINAAIPLFLQGDNQRLQNIFEALRTFLFFSGRWDEYLFLCHRAEEKAFDSNDYYSAGWRANNAAIIQFLRNQPDRFLFYASRCENYWQKITMEGNEKATIINLHGLGHLLKDEFQLAKDKFQEALVLYHTVSPESEEIVTTLFNLASIELELGDLNGYERDMRDAIRIAQRINSSEIDAILATYDIVYKFEGRELDELNNEELDKAEEIARRGLDLAEALRRQDLIGINCVDIADILAKKGKADDGRPFASRAVEIFTKLRSPHLSLALETLENCNG